MAEYLNIALPKGRLGEKAYDILEGIGFGCPSIREQNRKLIFENEENEEGGILLLGLDDFVRIND